MSPFIISALLFLLISTPTLVNSECTCDAADSTETTHNKTELLHLKMLAFLAILVLGAIGACIPLLGKKIQILQADKKLFFLIKAFAGGVILATGFIHVLPDAFESLNSPCLKNPWDSFPFTGFIAMLSAVLSLMIDSFSISFFENRDCVDHVDLENGDKTEQHGHGHVHGADVSDSELIKHRVNSHVLELGIIVHSVIIGISLGASSDADTIRPLVIAIAFHQFFEGMGLGGCIFQAKFRNLVTWLMVLFFALTTPMAILIGKAISNSYDENSPNALIISGALNAASSGILIYMALVDLLSPAFAHPKMKKSVLLQLGSCLCLLVGAGSMSLIAKWA